MATLLATMYLGTTFLAHVSGALPSASGESVLSQIGRSVYGSGLLWYVLQLSTMGILILAANTSFADFPRVASILAKDGYFPRQFSFRGERLAFNAGIVALAIVSIVLVAAFNGQVEALIPLYAIGVFTAFTLSQAGMVRHWFRERGAGWRRSAFLNGLGADHDGGRRGDLRHREIRPRRLDHPRGRAGAGRPDAVRSTMRTPSRPRASTSAPRSSSRIRTARSGSWSPRLP